MCLVTGKTQGALHKRCHRRRWMWVEFLYWNIFRLNGKFLALILKYFISVECKISEVEKCEGEAVANNRKGKLIFFYEWNIILKWKCPTAEKEKSKIEGKINIPNLSEENDISEVDVSNFLFFHFNFHEGYLQSVHYFISIIFADWNHTERQYWWRRENQAFIAYKRQRDNQGKIEELRIKFERRWLWTYFIELKVLIPGVYARDWSLLFVTFPEFTKGMILPKKDTLKENISNITSGFNVKMQMNSTINSSNNNQKAGVKISTTTVKQQQKFMCRGQEFYNVMTTPEVSVYRIICSNHFHFIKLTFRALLLFFLSRSWFIAQGRIHPLPTPPLFASFCVHLNTQHSVPIHWQ